MNPTDYILFFFFYPTLAHAVLADFGGLPQLIFFLDCRNTAMTSSAARSAVRRTIGGRALQRSMVEDLEVQPSYLSLHDTCDSAT